MWLCGLDLLIVIDGVVCNGRERDEGLMEEREKNIPKAMNSVLRWDSLTVIKLSWVTTQISQNCQKDVFELGMGPDWNLLEFLEYSTR